MDKELKSLTLNINQLAGITGIHRQTASARLKNVPQAQGSNSKLKLYRIVDVLTELMSPTTAVATIDDMGAGERLSHWRAENERIRFEESIRQLISADEVIYEYSQLAKAVVMTLETLPDILERDCALSPAAVLQVQGTIDELRDQLALKVQQTFVKEQEAAPEEG